MEELHELRSNLRRGLTTHLQSMRRTVLQVIGQQNLLRRVKRRMDGRELLHDVRAVSLILHHAADSVDLTPSPREPVQEILLRGLGDAHRV